MYIIIHSTQNQHFIRVEHIAFPIPQNTHNSGKDYQEYTIKRENAIVSQKLWRCAVKNAFVSICLMLGLFVHHAKILTYKSIVKILNCQQNSKFPLGFNLHFRCYLCRHSYGQFPSMQSAVLNSLMTSSDNGSRGLITDDSMLSHVVQQKCIFCNIVVVASNTIFSIYSFRINFELINQVPEKDFDAY